MGVSMRHVRRMAQSGALSYQIHMNAQNRPEYLFPAFQPARCGATEIFCGARARRAVGGGPGQAKKADKPAACKPLEAYTAEERGEIGYWITTVDRGQTYRNKAGTKESRVRRKICAAVPDGRARPSNQRRDALQKVGDHPRGRLWRTGGYARQGPQGHEQDAGGYRERFSVTFS